MTTWQFTLRIEMRLIITSILLLIVVLPNNNKSVQAAEAVCEQDGTCHSTSYKLQQSPPASSNNNDECNLVMAETTIPGGAGWGVFTTVDRPTPKTPLLFGDLAIHLTDLNTTYAAAARRLMLDYFWNAEQTGGFYEADRVVVSLPGIGMLANSLTDGNDNVLPFVPTVDAAGLTRAKSPGAGAVTYYHNYGWYVKEPLTAGAEIFVDYGAEYYRQHARPMVKKHRSSDGRRSVASLREHGYCLDHVGPGQSSLPHAGRGLLAARTLGKGTIVLPVPVMALSDHRALDITHRKGADGGSSWVEVNPKQLLLNYCLGHPNSTVLLVPYGPGFQLVNHASGDKRANVRLEWANAAAGMMIMSPHNVSLRQLAEWQDPQSPESPKFLLQLVATRKIRKGQEILLDYGTAWEKAWARHNTSWTERMETDTVHKKAYKKYVPSHALKTARSALRTMAETEKRPYPENIFTSCFYRLTPSKSSNNKKTKKITRQWQQTAGIFEAKHLRPCLLLERHRADNTYTVQIENRPGLPADQRVPSHQQHIVSNVPQRAIRLSDRAYTTDQHLDGAFRHPIGLADWPKEWMGTNG